MHACIVACQALMSITRMAHTSGAEGRESIGTFCASRNQLSPVLPVSAFPAGLVLAGFSLEQRSIGNQYAESISHTH